jgi:hypothetical protein
MPFIKGYLIKTTDIKKKCWSIKFEVDKLTNSLGKSIWSQSRRAHILKIL